MKIRNIEETGVEVKSNIINIVKCKKTILAGFLLVSVITAAGISCGSKKYTEMAVYPVQRDLETAAGGDGAISIKIEIPENHYIYSNPKGPGIGKATEVLLSSTKDLAFGEAKYPPAQKYIAPGLDKFVWIYRDETEIDIPYSVKEGARPGIYPVKIDLQALLCSESACTLQEFSAECSIRVTPGSGAGAGNITEGNRPLDAKFNVAEQPRDYDPYRGGDIKKESAFSPRYVSSGNITNIIQAILYGLLAGFLLNFMPCVLPVISLKIMDIVKHAGDNRKELVRLGLFFTLGIIISFAVLAGLAAFMGYNFGALFQKRMFLIIMIAVVFAMTLSLFEVFTINIPSFAIRASESYGRRATDMQPQLHLKVKDEKSNPYMDAFGKGVLTTLLATPCSGPFLGGTLAWAFTQTPAVIFIIFISIGLGMAMPYIILTIDPGLVRFIPKSGNWMITFERVMAFLLLATIIYLVGILEAGYVVPTLWFLLFIAIAFWQYGRFGSIIMAKRKRIISRILLVLIIISGYFLSYGLFHNDDNGNSLITGREFDVNMLHDNNDNDIITIVDFTADWCPNCKLVEKTSLYADDVLKAVREKNIQLLVADLTRENPPAEKLLKELGSRSIPFLAIFPKGKSFSSPICLRDIYSQEDVLNAIKMAE